MLGKTYLVSKANNKKFRLDGIRRSQRLPEKAQLRQTFAAHVLYGASQLPPKVDLRSEMTAVEDQSQLASCTANCLAGAYEYLTKKANGRETDVSRLFIYYNARVKGNDSEPITDSGCVMTDAIEALEEFGTCLESLWPYELARVNERPSDEAFDQAKAHRINEAIRVDIDLDQMKSCLAQGFPIAFGIDLFRTFDEASKSGVVPMPDPNDGARETHGSHAMLAVGYSDQSQAFIVRNSWGADWGDKGYCYIPYGYMTNPDFCFDVWTVRKLTNDDFGQDHWSYDDNDKYIDNDQTQNPVNPNTDDYAIETIIDDTNIPGYTENSDTCHANPTYESTNVEYTDDANQYITDSTTIDYSSTEYN
ncbi:unnamed protein product [Rotaria magnacalcarata]|uniref:Peptidase C1A papain C-terminal domain-containing protein n=3 Tax=Rotaria magnacalcarata TaxID=392030 RepID=A0A814JFB5_9BILA|nr:unnamed protein product [Rotaria magnacalcarata]CAF1676175.1 unnamed protein product [Rotaria magnacalcarata]CAF2117573.1 unnamed protein product [Rotaria magnacalcarata]